MEAMGLQLPGGSFVNPDTPLRDALTAEAAQHITRVTALGSKPKALGKMLDERSFVNAVVALLASGGSTNHTIHLIAMARAAGIIIDWTDFDELSRAVPLRPRVPQRSGGHQYFHAAGGTGYLLSQLMQHGFMHSDAETLGRLPSRLRDRTTVIRRSAVASPAKPKVWIPRCLLPQTLPLIRKVACGCSRVISVAVSSKHLQSNPNIVRCALKLWSSTINTLCKKNLIWRSGSRLCRRRSISGP